MTIDAISFLPPISMPALAPIDGPEAVPSSQFATWFSQQLTQVNDQLVTADQGVRLLAAGEASNLHQVMINLEEAKLSMQLVMQVRNHLLDAYHDLLQMQV
jgi:flagellar hook-basal body complex protein FliE